MPIEFSLENPNDIQQSKAVIIAKSIDSIETGPMEAAILEPYTFIEVMPEFPGGDEELMKFIEKNVKYPDSALKNKIEGTVFLNFIVNLDGQVSHVKVTKGISKELDIEAVRIAKAMPKWKPGKQGGQAVPVYFDILVNFQLKK